MAANVTAIQYLLHARHKITLKAAEAITLDRRRGNELTTKNTSWLQKKSLRTQGNKKDKIQLKGGLAPLREVSLGPLSVVL